MTFILRNRFLIVLTFLVATFSLPGWVTCHALQDENTETSSVEDELDKKVVEELARAEKLAANGKASKAIKDVESLFETTGSLRAGYGLSQLLQMRAMELSAKGNRKSAHQFFLKGGELARRLLADPDFPGKIRNEVRNGVYNEACSHAVMKDEEAAIKTLQDLFELGFEDFSQLESDTDFQSLANNESFIAIVREAKQKITERLVASAKKQIDSFESFDFDFEQSDLADRPLSLKNLKGKIVIVDFWGTWCPPCRAEIPSFIKLKEKYAGDIEIVGLAYERVDAEEAPAKVIEFGIKNKINYPCAIGTPETKKLVPEFRGYPTTLFIDRSGKVRTMKVGSASYEKLEAIVLALMQVQTSENGN